VEKSNYNDFRNIEGNNMGLKQQPKCGRRLKPFDEDLLEERD